MHICAPLCLFICSLCNDVVSSSSEAVALNDWMLVNNELEGVWEEAAVA
jgi:hypothetical protein